MIHAFRYMGVPQYILTDDMKSVVIRRDQEGHPVWQKDYEQFMRTVGFQTRLCKPRHPFTKGRVERLIRFVKDNFFAGRSLWNVTDLNLWPWIGAMNRTPAATGGWVFHRTSTPGDAPMWLRSWTIALRCCSTFARSAGFPLTGCEF